MIRVACNQGVETSHANPNRLNQWYQTARFPGTFKGGSQDFRRQPENEFTAPLKNVIQIIDFQRFNRYNFTVIDGKLSECLVCCENRETPTGVRHWWLTSHAGNFWGARGKFHFPSTPLCENRLVIRLRFEPILAEALAIRLKNSENDDHPSGPTLRPRNRSLSEILDLTVLVPNDHRVPRVNYRDVERTVVFTLEQKLCLIL